MLNTGTLSSQGARNSQFNLSGIISPRTPEGKAGGLLLEDRTPPQMKLRTYGANYICHRAKSRADFVKGVATAFMLSGSSGSNPFYVL